MASWDYAFVDELKPAPSDIIVPKARYSGFCGTALDNILRARDIRHLIFVGIATNVCVESTIRDAYHREFFCILAADATQQSGPAFIQDATLYNVERFLGWVTTTDAICSALEGVRGYDNPSERAEPQRPCYRAARRSSECISDGRPWPSLREICWAAFLSAVTSAGLGRSGRN